jgi:hypothetical protein
METRKFTLTRGLNVSVLVGGFNPTPKKNHGVNVSWDDEIPN